MHLQRSAQLAFVGVTYVYVMKISDPLLTSIMYTPLVIAIVVGLNILAGVAQLVFFLLLRKDVKSAANTVHLIASWCGICGAVAALVPKLLSVAVLVQHPFFFTVIKLQHEIGLGGPLAGALLLFLCCALFFMSMGAGDPRLTSFFFGLLGYSIMITVYSFVIWNYWSGAAMQAVLAEMGISRTAMLLSATASYLLIAAFFIRFGWLRGHSVQR